MGFQVFMFDFQRPEVNLQSLTRASQGLLGSEASSLRPLEGYWRPLEGNSNHWKAN